MSLIRGRHPAGPPVDPGLQPERTRMAWSRTSLAFVANGILHMHVGYRQGSWPWVVPGALVTVAGAAVYWIGFERFHRTDRAVRAGLPVAGTSLVATAAVLALMSGLCGLILALHA